MSIVEYTESQDEIIIFMENCNDAKFFETQLEEKKKEIKDENELRMYVKDILEGLKYMHDKNIIHADMKPGNLLI